MESLFLLAFGEEKSLAAPAMTGSEAFFNKLLDELAGFIASEANHAKNKKLHKEWQQLFDRIESVLNGHSDQDD